MKQNINFKSKNVKLLEESILMILKLLLNTKVAWIIFIKTLKNATQIRNVKD